MIKDESRKVTAYDIWRKKNATEGVRVRDPVKDMVPIVYDTSEGWEYISKGITGAQGEDEFKNWD